MPNAGDQIVAVAEHPAVGPDNGKAFRHRLHALRVESTVKPLRRWNRAVMGMVGQQQGQGDLRVELLRFPDGVGRQAVKGPIVPHHELGDAVLCDMPLHLPHQRGQNPLRRVPVADEKAGFRTARPLSSSPSKCVSR